VDDQAHKPRTRGRWRLAARCGVLALAVALALQVLPWEWTPMVVPALSPFVAVCAAVAARTVGMASALGLAVLVTVAVRPRWFCRNVCPMGLVLDGVRRVRPGSGPTMAKVPRVGQWAVLLTLGGALVGTPLLLWLDPLAMFNGFFSVWRQPFGLPGVLAGIGLPVVVALTLAWPRVWCGRLCPLGATQDLVTELKRRLRRNGQSAADAPATPAGGVALVRRSVLAVAVGASGAALVGKWGNRPGTKPLRPPGALDERRFTGVCVRCGNCVRACPSGIIEPDLGGHGAASLLSPVLCFDYKYCLEDCTRCTQVCPSGAIVPLSLEVKRRTKVGVARLDMTLCVLSDGVECGACANQCPYDAIELRFDEDTYESTVRVLPENCTGCGACELACMTSPEKAIRVVPV